MLNTRQTLATLGLLFWIIVLYRSWSTPAAVKPDHGIPKGEHGTPVFSQRLVAVGDLHGGASQLQLHRGLCTERSELIVR